MVTDEIVCLSHDFSVFLQTRNLENMLFHTSKTTNARGFGNLLTSQYLISIHARVFKFGSIRDTNQRKQSVIPHLFYITFVYFTYWKT